MKVFRHHHQAPRRLALGTASTPLQGAGRASLQKELLKPMVEAFRA
jgi:hypothetical protein